MAVVPAAVAAVRVAVRRCLTESGTGPVLVACSGGADSLALAAATAFVAPRLGVPAGLVTVDHQLQDGSAERAEAVAGWARERGLAPVVVRTVAATGRGGPEARARNARYAALAQAATEQGAGTVLLGHTREDQAETVLLALLRGAGPRGLSGMPAHRRLHGATFSRPLLDLGRAQTRAACVDLGMSAWDDPHNHDPAFARTRARQLLDLLADRLGPGVVANLARTAGLLAADAQVLDELAGSARGRAAQGGNGLAVSVLADLPSAVRTRALHDWARSLGSSGSALSQRLVRALDALVVDWHGQGPVHLPGGHTVARIGDRLISGPPPPRSEPPAVGAAGRRGRGRVLVTGPL
jgi:tRNA(Ile)-lysidine synthase